MLIGYCSGIQNCGRIADVGYDYIECNGFEIAALSDGDFTGAVKTLDLAGIPCRGFARSVPPEVRICGPGYDRTAIAEYAGRCCERGAGLGIKNIGLGSPKSRNLPSGFDITLASQQLIQTIGVFCEKALPYGINILFESVSSPMCNFITLFPEAADIVEKLRIPNLFLVMDLYHLSVMGESPEDYEGRLADVRHLHIAEKEDQGQLRYEKEGQYKAWTDFLKTNGCDTSISVETASGSPVGSERSLEILRRIYRN